MFVGPVFTRELVTAPRRVRHFLYRGVYVAGLLVLVCTAFLVLTGTQIVRNVGDMARFGGALFQILAPLQLAIVSFLAALRAASAIAQEKDRRTLVLLMMTRLNNSELVLGKLAASLLDVGVMVFSGLPLFMLIPLFGGVSFLEVGRVFLVTLATALACGSLGGLIAFAREKTFQSLALTALVIVIWVGVGEAVGAGLLGPSLANIPAATWGEWWSPLRAVAAAASPVYAGGEEAPGLDGVFVYGSVMLALATMMNGAAIALVRVWNPSRELRLQAPEEAAASIWGVEHDLAQQQAAPETRETPAEAARSTHVDAQLRAPGRRSQSRPVWDNPILWREVRTWAYGRKVVIIKVAFLCFFAMAALGVHQSLTPAERTREGAGNAIPPAARSLAPLLLISLVILNALAVNSVTNERDGGALDLLLVTDLTPPEFVFGKLGGVLWLSREMIVLPMLLFGYLCWRGGLSFENLLYTLGSLAVMQIFVAMLGIHCGMTYANSRSAIGVSLGVVFFLFLGVVTCLLLMISFSGSFQTQLPPFLLFILGGGIGLFVALGIRNPSAAILAASMILPLATFFAITSFVLRNRELSIFLVLASSYGFTTAAMLVPALYEFDFAMGRTKGGGEE